MKIRFKETQKIINRFFLLILIISSMIKCGSVMDMLDPKVNVATSEPSVPSHIVTFDPNGGTGTMADQSISDNTSANLNPNIFMKPGFDFVGWATSAGGSVVYPDGGSFFMATSNVMLYAKWAWKTYNLRDTGPATGIIFYINPNSAVDGWKYLEAAPANYGSTVAWSNVTSMLIGGTSTAIGLGPLNTGLIIGQMSHSNSSARVCDEFTYGGYNDWFLPSRDELSKMYINLKSGTDEYSVSYTPNPSFVGTNYWSSSEYTTPTQAYYINFTSGTSIVASKGNPYYVRPVRRF